MTKVCYLCGKGISVEDVVSDDHVVPKQFIKRSQPKTKGFDYAGKLPSHEKCNNRFGPEIYCQKAITIIQVLYNENCFVKRQHRDNPSITILALNSDCFPGFTDRDLKYFKLIDVRNLDISEISNPEFFNDKVKTNPKKGALFSALSVLTKSAAALLVSRNLSELPEHWKVLAIPYVGAHKVDFDELFGCTKPFEIGVKCWIKQMESGDWFVAYKAEGVLVYFLFSVTGDKPTLDGISKIFSDADIYKFEGDRLMELVDFEWEKV